MAPTGDEGPQPSWNLDAAGAVQRTLAIPLVGRALAHQMFPALGFFDPEAGRLLSALRFAGTEALARHKKTVWGSIVRTQAFDDVTRRFLSSHPGATVLNLGAGLCTRQQRAGQLAGRWIEADVADVIHAKARLSPPGAHTLRIPVDLGDPLAVHRVLDVALGGGSRPVLVIAEGVTMFLPKHAMLRLLSQLEQRLPLGSQIVFDYLHPTTRRLAQRLHPSLRVTGASYASDLRPATELAELPRLRPLGLRLFTSRYGRGMRLADRALGLVLAGGAPLYDVALVEVAPPREKRATHPGVVATTFAAFAALFAASALAPHPALTLVAQIALALVILRSFCLVHDLSHGALLASGRRNDLLGVVASLLCALPYYPWKRIHVEHHKWAGWKEKDPTESDSDFDDLEPVEQALASWAWKLSLPLLGLSFSLRTFWNLPRLHRLFPRDRRAFLFSVLVIPAAHGLAFALLGTTYLAAYLPAFALFLFLSDPIMLSQHVGIPLARPPGDPRPLAHKDQQHLARTLLFPRWFARHVLLGFNFHALHHERPGLPGHLLDAVPHTPTYAEDWWSWLKRAKRTPLGELLSRGD